MLHNKILVCFSRGNQRYRISSDQDVHEASQHWGQTSSVHQVRNYPSSSLISSRNLFPSVTFSSDPKLQPIRIFQKSENAQLCVYFQVKLTLFYDGAHVWWGFLDSNMDSIRNIGLSIHIEVAVNKYSYGTQCKPLWKPHQSLLSTIVCLYLHFFYFLMTFPQQKLLRWCWWWW